VKAGPKHEILGTNSVGEPVYASPAVADGKIFIRGRGTSTASVVERRSASAQNRLRLRAVLTFRPQLNTTKESAMKLFRQISIRAF